MALILDCEGVGAGPKGYRLGFRVQGLEYLPKQQEGTGSSSADMEEENRQRSIWLYTLNPTP